MLRGGGTSYSMVAYGGQPAPVAGYVVGPFVSGANSRHPYIAEDGSISFFSSLRCATSNCVPSSLESVLTVTPAGALAVGAIEDEAALSGGVQYSTFWNWPQASDGALAVRGWLKGNGVNGNNDDFIGLGAPGATAVIAREGDPAPGTNLNFVYFDRPSVNPNRDMVFVAGVNSSSASLIEGIWRHTFGRLDIVVRDHSGFRSAWSRNSRACRTIGDVLPLSETRDGTGGGDGQPRQFDRDGRLVFRAVSTEINQYGVYIAEPTDAIAADRPIIHLNFGEAYHRVSEVRPDWIVNGQLVFGRDQLEWVNGNSPLVPLSTLSTADREEIARRMREMLCLSGVDIPVSLDAPGRTNNVVTVFFTPLGTNHLYRTGTVTNGVPDRARLLGTAHEVDQFNTIDAQDVIVAVDDGSITGLADSNENLAKTVLHEVGHTFGLAHINPYQGNPIELMDYASVNNSLERFTNEDPTSGAFDMRIVQPPNDGVFDHLDNCTTYANANQRDTDGDGFGNRCDGDFNNDNIVNAADQNILRARFMTNDPHADLNGDGIVNSLDLGLFKGLYMLPPGPARTLP